MRLLAINSGSSSLKAALYEMGEAERLVLAAGVERIGIEGSRVLIKDAGGAILLDQQRDLPGHDAALQALFDWLDQHDADRVPSGWLDAVGHRVVHGGSRYHAPQRITPELVAALQELVPIDPAHMPQALSGIRAVSHSYPDLQQVACFDTAFHRRMPRVAQIYALPRHFADDGVVRYGFHGLSYEYIMQELRAVDSAGADGRVIVAHLGNGASMAAVRGGTSVDTTMGFTPTGGLVMGTRSGDLDPGVLLYLLQERGMQPAELNELLNKRSGLLGVSGISADMRDLLQREATDAHAAEAIALFCYQARKSLGAYAAALGGLDTLIFTGGIGEHAAAIRERICTGMEFLGLELDAGRNAANAPVISTDGSTVTVRVITTDENMMVARHTRRAITG